MLILEHIYKGYGDHGESNFRDVLRDVNLEIREGESLAILGPSGSGKTTLLNLIGGMDRPDSGSLKFKGDDMAVYSEREMDQYRNREIGFVFQFHHLLPQCTLKENILLPTLVNASRKNRIEKAGHAEKLMKRVGIWDYRDKLPSKLSGGECQRAAVVRAIINRPSLLLADEPTGALDADNVGLLAELLLELNREDGLTLMVVTHSSELASRMGKTLHIRDGKPELAG